MSGFVNPFQAIVGVKSESTYGTDAFGGSAPADANVLPFATFNTTQVIPVVESDRMTATNAGECDSRTPSHNEIEWSCLLFGSSAAGVAPPVDPLLKAAGFAATIVTDTSVTYTPEVQNSDTLTPAFTGVLYERTMTDGNARKVLTRGARTNLTLTMEVGAEAMLSGSAQGLYDEYVGTTAALPTLPAAYAGDQCGWMVNTLALTVGGTTYPCEGMTFNTNNTLEQIKTGDSTGGGMVSKVLLTKPKSGSRFGGSFTLADGATALTEAIALWKSGAKASLVAVLTKGSRAITIEGSIQFTLLEQGSKPRYPITYAFVRPNGESGANFMTIAFT